MSTSDLWKITTKEAGDSFDPPDDMKSMVADIEAAAAGAPRLFDTYADLLAFANPFTGMGARVTSDSTASSNGDYVYSGSAWVQTWCDTGWITMTLPNSYTSIDSVCAYRKKGTLVELKGAAQYSSGIPSGQVVFTLPSGFRPAGYYRGSTPTGAGTDTIRRLNIPTTGAITLNGSGSGTVTWQALDGIVFETN